MVAIKMPCGTSMDMKTRGEEGFGAGAYLNTCNVTKSSRFQKTVLITRGEVVRRDSLILLTSCRC